MTNPASLPVNALPINARRARSAVPVGVLMLAGLSVAAVGCSDYSHQIAGDIRDNPAPELMTLWERPVDVDNHIALTRNTNFRAMWEDLGRVMLLDRPSPMTLEPMPR